MIEICQRLPKAGFWRGTLLSLVCGFSSAIEVIAADTIGRSRHWKSQAGTTVEGALIRVYDGKVGLRIADGREVDVSLEQISEADQLLVKRTITSDFRRYLRETLELSSDDSGDLAKSWEWPAVFFVPDEFVEDIRISQSNDWTVAKSKHWEIRSQIPLEEIAVRDLANLLEGTVLSASLISPKFANHGETFMFRLFENTEELEKSDDEAKPGYNRREREIYALPEMIGLEKLEDRWLLDPEFSNEYLKEEIVELAMVHAGAAAKIPYWFYYGSSRLVSRIPHRGASWFPRAALEEFRSQSLVDQVSGEMDVALRMDEKSWNEPNDELRKDRSMPRYFRHMSEAATAALAQFRILNEDKQVNFARMIRLASDREGNSSEKDLTRELAGDSKEWGSRFSSAIANYLGDDPAALEASTVARPRVWENSSGKKLSAQLRGVAAGGKVLLLTPDGTTYPIPVATLSKRDQAFVLMNLVKMIDYGSILSKFTKTDVQTTTSFPPLLEMPKGLARSNYDSRNSEGGKHIYTTKNFKFTYYGSNPIKDASALAYWFEGTKELLSKSPLGVQAQKVDGYFHADLFESEAAYKLAGGPSLSSGVYIRSKKKFLMPAKAESGRFSFKMETLVHEITHMMMHDILTTLPKWVIEGTAEYVEHIPSAADQFRHGDSNYGGLKAYSKYYEKWSKSLELVDGTMSEPYPPVYDFGELLKITSEEWRNYVDGNQAKQSCLYYSSFLLTYYFLNVNRNKFIEFFNRGRAGIEQWKVYEFEMDRYEKDLEEFKKLPGVKKAEGGGYTFPRHLAHPVVPVRPGQNVDSAMMHLDALLDGRSPAQIDEEARAWFRKKQVFLGNED